MKYLIHKLQEPTRKPWQLKAQPEEGMVPQNLATYETLKEAKTVASLLAGRTGSVEVVK